MTNQFPDATKMVFPPNDLSHLSDEELNNLAPQGYHATGPAKPLSPAAQAVLDAYIQGLATKRRNAIGAALRAAADQAIPVTKTPWGSILVPVLTAQESRNLLLAIATELDNNAIHTKHT
jgi:hypothetical protein